MISIEDQAFLIDALPFWDTLQPSDRNRILTGVTLRRYSPGSVVKSVSEECSGLLLVKNGQIRAFFEGENGKEITLYRLLSLDLCILSAPCVLKSITFDISLEAEKESDIIQIPSLIWSALSSAHPEVQRFTMELVNSRFSDVMWVLDQLISKNLGQRVSAFLREQSVLEDSDTLHITHEAIANNLGTAREVVSRVLKYYESEGALELSRGAIHIVDRNRLSL